MHRLENLLKLIKFEIIFLHFIPSNALKSCWSNIFETPIITILSFYPLLPNTLSQRFNKPLPSTLNTPLLYSVMYFMFCAVKIVSLHHYFKWKEKDRKNVRKPLLKLLLLIFLINNGCSSDKTLYLFLIFPSNTVSHCIRCILQV